MGYAAKLGSSGGSNLELVNIFNNAVYDFSSSANPGYNHISIQNIEIGTYYVLLGSGGTPNNTYNSSFGQDDDTPLIMGFNHYPSSNPAANCLFWIFKAKYTTFNFYAAISSSAKTKYVRISLTKIGK